MDFDKKRLILLIILIIVALGIAVALYLFFFRSQPDETQIIVIDGEPVEVGQLPAINEGRPTGIYIDPDTGLPVFVDEDGNVVPLETPDEPTPVVEQVDETAQGGPTRVESVVPGDVTSLLPSTDGELRFYERESGQFWRLNEQGEFELLSDDVFFNVEEVAWDKDGDQAILEYPDGSNIYYNFNTKEQVSLPKQMTDFDFSYTNDKIAYEWYNELDEDDNWLGVATPDGSSISFIEPIADQGNRVDPMFSPDGRYIALYNKGTGLDQVEVLPIGENNENFRSFEAYGRGFEPKWSSDNKSLVYSVHSERNDRKPELWVAHPDDTGGMVQQSLGLSTWAHKCTFNRSGTDLYCAVPQNLPANVGWFPELDEDYEDHFYHVDLETGRTSKLAEPVGNRPYYSASQMIVSADGSKLYFTDQLTNDIFSINLK